MANSPLTGSRYPTSSSVPNVPQDIQNAVTDLEDNSVPRFTTTTARDTAFSNWVAAGNSLVDGLLCVVGNKPLEYRSGAWCSLANPTLYRSARRVTNNVLGNATQTYGTSSSGEIVLPAATYGNQRAVDIQAIFDIWCDNSAASAGTIQINANNTALLATSGAQLGTFSNAVSLTGFGSRSVVGRAHWAGMLPAAAQNVWAQITSDSTSQSFWVLSIDLTVIER